MKKPWLVAIVVAACGGSPKPLPSSAAPSGAELAGLVAKARELQQAHANTVTMIEPGKTHADAEIVATLRKAVCTNRAAYATCVPLPGDAALVARAWMMLGDEHLAAGENAEALVAFERCAAAGVAELVEPARYKAAWAAYRANQLDDAAARFDRVLRETKDAKLREEAVMYLALSFVDRNPDNPGAGLDAALAHYRARRDPYLFDVFAAVGDALGEALATADAKRAYDHALATWPDAPNRAHVETRRAKLRQPP